MIGKKINQLATELAPVSTDLTIIGDPTTGVSKKITLAQLGAIFSGAVSFYTNLAGFPAVGDINVIYCAKDTQKLYLWSGSAYVEVFPSQALLDTYQLRSEKGNANGYASLDSQGKVPISQLPSSIMEYKGTWNASTNTPTLANGTGDTGDVYICNVAGTVNFGAGPITFAVGDYVIYSGTIWQRSSGAVGTVTSVAASITGNSVTISGSPVTTSGTLAFAFAGTGAQYIKGDGTLATFPNTIDQAKNLITEVYNSTGSTLTKGTVVYINGGQGNLPTVTKALASGDSTSAQTYGIVQADITNNNNGFVVVAGRLTDIDTQAYTNGTQLYLSSTTAGAYTSTKQYAPAHLVYIGIIVRSHPTQGVIEVKIQNGYELDELHNVAAQSPSNGDILQYVSSTSLWTKVAGTTSNIAEGSNLYYTDARSRAALSFTAGSGAYNSTTGVITIPTNTNQLTNGANYITLASLSAGAGISYNNTTGVIASTITQYTDALARAAISLTTSGTSGAATYNSTTGVLNVPQYAPDLSGYVPTSRTLTINGTAFDLSANRSWSVGTVTSVGLSSATSGVTIGSTPITTSGTITLAIATASGSQQGLLSSTDWTTFNNKQNALTNPVTGTGTTNYLPKFTGTSTIGNSIINEGSGVINIGTTASTTYGTLNVIQNSIASPNWVRGIQIVHPNGTGVTGGYISISNIGQKLGGIQVGDDAAVGDLVINPVGGNLGLGVTPSASQDPLLESRYGLFMGRDETNLLNNAYFNSGWKYAQTGSFANRYYQNGYNGGHQWLIAPSGTAGNAISFTQAMTLNASGNLSIGNTNDTYKLDVSGTGRFSQNLIVNGTSSAYGLKIIGSSTTGASYGLVVLSGTNSSDYSVRVRNQADNADFFTILGSGAATFSSSVTAGGSITTNSGGVIIGTGSGSNWQVYKDPSTSFLGMYLSGASPFMVINSSGNVGIGSTNPQSKFEVVDGTGCVFRAVTNGINIMEIGNYKPTGSGGAGYQQLDITSSIITFNTGSAGGGSATERLRISSTGLATFTGDVKVKTLEVTNVGTYGSSAGISTYMAITVNGQNYVIPLHGTP
jgi:hypothetical protein